MDKIAKLFKKISSADCSALLALTQGLIAGDRTVRVVKLKNTDFYRARYKNFRLIFHQDETAGLVIDSIKIRNDNTYKRL